MSERRFFVLLSMGLSLIMTGENTSCPIELSPPSVVVKYGDPVTINCSATKRDHSGLGWEAPVGGTGLQKVNFLPWTVASLTQWDISPMCYTSLSEHKNEHCIVRPGLVVYTFPDTISIKFSGGSGGGMDEGQESPLICDIGNVAPLQNLSVTWYKGDAILSQQTFTNSTREPASPSSVLKFTPTREDSGSRLRCEAHLDLGPLGPNLTVSSQELVISVFYGPTILCSVVEIMEGQTLDEECPVTGNPTPTVRWFLDEQPVDSSVPFMRENTGLYTVQAEGFTSIKSDVKFIVLYGPELACPSTYTALEHAPHNLTCTVEGYPRPKIIWYKDGEEVELSERLTRRDAGQYVITASNNLTSVNATVEVVVLYPPSEIVELEDTEIDLGSDVWLKCTSVGNPRPKYTWNYYHTDNVMEESDDGVSRLVIHNATAHNMGTYTCRASNVIGEVYKTVTVTVNGASQECPVKITPDPMVVEYQTKGHHATCGSTSTHPANIRQMHWQIVQDNKTIQLDGESWFPDTQNGWGSSPSCTGEFVGIGTCEKKLNYILFKTPDRVSVHAVDNSSSVLEDRAFLLQCDVVNVAPAQKLTVRWYRGNESIGPGVLSLVDCGPGDSRSCNMDLIMSPVNVTSTVSVTLNRLHRDTEIRCQAQLELEVPGWQAPLSMESEPLNITVLYKPTINTTKLPKTVPLFRGYPEELVCEASGHPAPQVQWLYSSDKVVQVSGGNLTVYEEGIYNCSARNDVDSTLHVVEVVLKGNLVNACQLQMSPKRVFLRYGDPLSANCSSTSDVSSMGWESTYGGTGLQKGVSFLPLDIKSVETWEFGPQCYANPRSAGSQCVQTLEVIVYNPPESVSMSDLSVPLVEGQQRQIKCDVVNVAPAKRLVVNWYKGNKNIFTNTFKESSLTPQNMSSVFEFAPHRNDSESTVWCEATLALDSGEVNPPRLRSKSQQLTVLSPPKFSTPSNETVALPAGKTVSLDCTATGNPIPVYRWHFPDPTLVTNGQQNVDEPTLTPAFPVPGTYVCTASNSLGKSTKHFSVVRASEDQTTFAALLGVFITVGVLLAVSGLFFVTQDGTFSFNKNGYIPGQTTSSAPV